MLLAVRSMLNMGIDASLVVIAKSDAPVLSPAQTAFAVRHGASIVLMVEK